MMGDPIYLTQSWTHDDLRLELASSDPERRVRERIEFYARRRGIGLFEIRNAGAAGVVAWFTNPVGQPGRTRDESGRWLYGPSRKIVEAE